MNLGIIISSGGAAFSAMAEILKDDDITFHMVTDRPCGAEDVAAALGIEHERIEARSRREFSYESAKWLKARDIGDCLLFFDRLVSPDLFEAIRTANIHPAALPAFPGLHGVEDAFQSGTRLLGCSLHQVDETMDGGPIIAQIARGMEQGLPIERWQNYAFLMKVWCGLVWVSAVAAPSLYPDLTAIPVNASHPLPKHWLQGFAALQAREGICVLQLS